MQRFRQICNQLALAARIAAQTDPSVVRTPFCCKQLSRVHQFVERPDVDDTVALKDGVVHIGTARHGTAVRLGKNLPLHTAAEFERNDHNAARCGALQCRQKRLGLAHGFQHQTNHAGRRLRDQKVDVLGHARGQLLSGRNGVVKAQLAQVAHDARPGRAAVRDQGHLARLFERRERKTRHLQLVFQIDKAHAVGTAQLHVAFARNACQGVHQGFTAVGVPMGAAKKHGRACLGLRSQSQLLGQRGICHRHGHTVHRLRQSGQMGIGGAAVDLGVLGVDEENLALITQGLDGGQQLLPKAISASTRAHNGDRAWAQQGVQLVVHSL